MIDQASPFAVSDPNGESTPLPQFPVVVVEPSPEAIDDAPTGSPDDCTGEQSEPPRRLRLTDSVLAALYADFDKHGAWAIERMRLEEPTQYVKLIVSLLPSTLIKKFEQHRLSEAATMSPDEVLDLHNGKKRHDVVEQVCR